MTRLLREPLVHFILIGAVLFLLFNFTNGPAGDKPNRIVVMPSQVEQMEARFSRTWMRPPTKKELAGLIESHVRDEVYYREAVAMGLDRNDPTVRRQMRLKLEFLLEDLEVGERVLLVTPDRPTDDFHGNYLRLLKPVTISAEGETREALGARLRQEYDLNPREDCSTCHR